MKSIRVVAAIIVNKGKAFATQRGYGEWKDWWEFPGGKIEEGESPEEALAREIREELGVEIGIDEFCETVEYDYPKFHLVMDCFICHIKSGEPVLLEHEAAKWLGAEDIDSVKWLPSDVELIQKLKGVLQQLQ